MKNDSTFTKFAVLNKANASIYLFVYPTKKLLSIAEERYNNCFEDACTEVVADVFSLDKVAFTTSQEDIPTTAINVKW